MNETCSKCTARLEASWKFCPQCGAASVGKVVPETGQTHITHEKAPAKSGLCGLVLGILAAPVLIIYGGMICLTGLGIVLGLPMIIAGVCAPLVGALVGLNVLRGKCPWCDAKVSGVGLFDRFSCPACNKLIVMRKRDLIRAE